MDAAAATAVPVHSTVATCEFRRHVHVAVTSSRRRHRRHVHVMSRRRQLVRHVLTLLPSRTFVMINYYIIKAYYSYHGT